MYNSLKKVEFREWELSEKAFEVYSNSSFCFWTDGVNVYYSDNQNSKAVELGTTIEDVEAFLLVFAELPED